jgi:catechol 2,3-dioxygenase-like lactoylglutathione lyase family enzyme
MKLLGLDHIGIIVRDINETIARAGDTVDGTAVGERILAGDIDLQLLLFGETRLELIEARAAGFGMPKLKDDETAVIGHLGYEVDDLEETSRTHTPGGRPAGRTQDRRGPLHLHSAAHHVRSDPAAHAAQAPRDGRLSAEGSSAWRTP